jgi:hypothetical protein
MINEITEGQKFNGICCAGYDWEAVVKLLDWWGVCHNPDCQVEIGTHYHGVSHFDIDDIEMRNDT